MKKHILTVITRLYNKIMSTRFINRGGKIIKRIRLMLMHNICIEFDGSFGNLNPDRKFYVIRCPQDTMGFFGVYNYVVDYMKIADELGYEPVVDWQYYPNGGTTADNYIGKENSWNWYFEATTDVSLEEVYKSKNVHLSGGNNYASLGEMYDYDKIDYSRRIVKKYIQLNKELRTEYKNTLCRLNMKGKRVLGVLARGTYFVTNKPKDHATVPDNSLLIDAIKKVEEENGQYDLIFLATEDEQIKTMLKEEFDDRIVYSQEKMVERVDGKWVNELFDDNRYQDTKIQIAKEYLISITLLASCTDLLASMVGGTLGAVRISDGYKNFYLINEQGRRKITYDQKDRT